MTLEESTFRAFGDILELKKTSFKHNAVLLVFTLRKTNYFQTIILTEICYICRLY